MTNSAQESRPHYSCKEIVYGHRAAIMTPLVETAPVLIVLDSTSAKVAVEESEESCNGCFSVDRSPPKSKSRKDRPI